MAFGLKSGAVGVPRWIIILRALQLFFAILIIALTAYALSIYSGGPIQPALIAAIIIAVLTILPILPLVTPLHLIQRRTYDPRLALALDLSALLFWLGAFAALASYHDVFSNYGRLTYALNVCRKCRSAWRNGVAATVFAAFEFLLFLVTTLTFIYYYHHHIAGTTAPGLSPRSGGGHRNGEGFAETGTVGAAGTGVGAGSHTPATRNNNNHEMNSMPTHNAGHPGNPNYAVPPPPPVPTGYGNGAGPASNGPASGGYGNGGSAMMSGGVHGQGQGLPYPDHDGPTTRTTIQGGI